MLEGQGQGAAIVEWHFEESCDSEACGGKYAERERGVGAAGMRNMGACCSHLQVSLSMVER